MTITEFNQIIASSLVTVTRVAGINATSYVTSANQYVLLDSQFPTDELEQQSLIDSILERLGLCILFT